MPAEKTESSPNALINDVYSPSSVLNDSEAELSLQLSSTTETTGTSKLDSSSCSVSSELSLHLSSSNASKLDSSNRSGSSELGSSVTISNSESRITAHDLEDLKSLQAELDGLACDAPAAVVGGENYGGRNNKTTANSAETSVFSGTPVSNKISIITSPSVVSVKQSAADSKGKLAKNKVTVPMPSDSKVAATAAGSKIVPIDLFQDLHKMPASVFLVPNQSVGAPAGSVLTRSVITTTASDVQQQSIPVVSTTIQGGAGGGGSSSSSSSGTIDITKLIQSSTSTKGQVFNSAGNPVITKVIITGNTLTGQSTIQNLPVVTVPVSTATTAGVNQGGGSTSGVKILTATQPKAVVTNTTPTKTLSVIDSASLSSQSKPQIITTVPGTPSGQTIMMGKFAISPKTPTRIAMVPVSIKSPQRIAPAPLGTVQMVAKGSIATAVTAHATTTVTNTVPKVSTLAVSPSKVIIKPAVTSTSSVTNAVKQLAFTSTSSTSVPIQVPGSKFSYIRLVTSPMTGTQAGKTIKQHILAPATLARPIAPATVQPQFQSPNAAPVKIVQIPPGLNSKQSVNQQRIIIPASSVTNVAQVRPAVSGASGGITVPGGTLTQIPPGTAFISSEGNIVMVHAPYVTQQQLTANAQHVTSTVGTTIAQPTILPVQSARQPTNLVPIAAAASSSNLEMTPQAALPSLVPRPQVNGRTPVEANGLRPRKPCNCTKSQCLKLYCDCFANGEFCHNCNCSNCYNNLDHEEERQKAIKACLERNPQAFHPKIGKAKDGEHERRHNKGCNCKRSGCLKNYCECYEAKIMCSSSCKCIGCKNFEESAERKTLMHLADAAEVRVQQQAAAKTKMSSQMQDVPTKSSSGNASAERLLCSFITNDVVEATCQCLLAQIEEGREWNMSETAVEQKIIEEFGRCLMQIIEYANKTKS